MQFDDLDIDALRRRRGKKWHTFEPEILPAWVADMDFPLAPAIQRRLNEVFEASDFGYPDDHQTERLTELLAERCRRRWGWGINPARVEPITDVVQGLQMCLRMYSRSAEGAAILAPIYPPFLTATAAMGRRVDCHTLSPGAESYGFDPERLAAALKADTRLLLLCNPHNPTGRVFTREELMQLAELALHRDLVVVADEIHADLAFDGHTHVPFASLGPEIQARTVTLLSASKAFNTAGLRCAMMVFGSPALQAVYRDGPRCTRGAASSLGMHATEAAWSECDAWLAALLVHLQGHRRRIERFVADRLPDVRFLPPQATYLAWLDCRAFGLGDRLWRTILDRGRLAVNDGRAFGPGGDGCVRLNFATSGAILDEALARLERALGQQ